MSLIADALKTAQRESAKRGAPSSANTRSTEGFFAYRKTRSDTRSTRLVVIAGAGMASIIALGVVLYARSGTPSKNPVAPPALMADVTPAPAAATPVVPTPTPDSVGAQSAMFQFEERAGATQQPNTPLTLRPLTATTPAPAPDAFSRSSPIASGPSTTPVPATIIPQTALSPAPSSDTSSPVDAAPARTPAARSGNGSLRITVEGGSTDRAVAGLGQQALDAQRRGDAAHARRLYERLLAQGGATAEIYNNMGALERGAGNLAAAAEQFRNAIAVDRGYAAAWSNLGIVLDAMGKRVDATAAYQQALKLDPSNVATKLNLALQYRVAGLPDDARRLLDDVVRAAPDFAEGHYALGQVLEDAGDRSGAVRQFELFLKTAGTRLPAASESVRRHLAQLGAAQR